MYSVYLSIVNLEVTTLNSDKFYFFEVTWQQVSKQTKKVNNWCRYKHVSVGVFSCERCERREKQVLKLLIQASWDVAEFQLVKGDFQQGNIAYISRNWQWKNNIAYIYSVEQLKNNGFSFTKIGNPYLLY
jgi:hypothetical protein